MVTDPAERQAAARQLRESAELNLLHDRIVAAEAAAASIPELRDELERARTQSEIARNRADALERELTRVRGVVLTLERDLTLTRDKLNRIVTSLPWRVSAPVRGVVSRLRRG